MNAAWLADPHSGPGLHELTPDVAADHSMLPAQAAATDSVTVIEPAMHAVDGYLLVRFLGGPPRRYYVGRGPDFIAEQLESARLRGEQTYSYWDIPGWSGAQRITIPCQLATEVRVQHLEPDFDALVDDLDNYIVG